MIPIFATSTILQSKIRCVDEMVPQKNFMGYLGPEGLIG